MIHKVKLKAKNSSGEQTLFIDINEKYLDGLVALTLVGTYEGNDIQIDFDPIDEKEFAKTLLFIFIQIEQTDK